MTLTIIILLATVAMFIAGKVRADIVALCSLAVLMAPIAMSAATELGVNPLPMLFAVTLGASMCFASPFSTPPNALVMHAGNYTFSDYIKVGLPLQIIMGIVMTFALPLFFPF